MEVLLFLVFYIYVFIFGIIGLSLSSKLFNKFPDKGYGFAKIIGLIIVALPIWLLSSLHIVQFNELTSFLSLVVFALLAIVYLAKSNFKLNKYIILEELIFFLILLIWSLIRATNPQIYGTEKFMNLAFMNSINRTTFFPPLDPWYSGESINYYYLGHYFYTFLGKITSLKMGIIYNLSLNFVISQAFISLFSCFTKLFEDFRPIKKTAIGIIGAIAILFGGNLDYFFHVIHATITNTNLNYYFSRSTRLIPFTINEYPSYSVVLGDLHGHYNVLPFLLLVIGLSLVYFKIKSFTSHKLIFSVVISIPIALLYGINSWDFITINILFLCLNSLQVLQEKNNITDRYKKLKSIKYKALLEIFLRAIYLVFLQLLLVLPGMIMLLPYIINFIPAVHGIGFITEAPRSPLKPWLLIWGAFIIVNIGFIPIFLFNKFRTKLKYLEWILVIVFISLGLIIGVEFVFIKDLFFKANPQYFRTNTVFKFYYHAWILWGIASIYFAAHILTNMKKIIRFNVIRIIIGILFLALYLGSVMYIFKAVGDFYPWRKIAHGTLDGNTYISTLNIGDYKAINWINKNIDKQPILAEATGPAYSYHSRISTNTGLPTVIGWITHEWQWRDNLDAINIRAQDIKSLYTTTDIHLAFSITKKYNISYIYLGELERSKYKNTNKAMLDKWFHKVYDADNVSIYDTN